jgi:uncharacterized membrane protein YphA (DoxX/SURF4 family)
MRRLFPAFPDGGPGFGLLILRVVAGVVAVVQGGVGLAGATHPTLSTWITGCLAIASGAAVLVGFLTPGAGILLGLTVPLFWLPSRAEGLFLDRIAALFVMANATAIAFLGPGAFSVDSRLFGHREILILPDPESPKP